MYNSINEEDDQENCLKFFIAILHGIFIEN
jgi:hypothetical protein